MSAGIEDLTITVEDTAASDEYIHNEHEETSEEYTEPKGLFADADESVDPTFVRGDKRADKKLISGDRRKPGALKYEKKMRSVFRDLALMTVVNPRTQYDFAAITLHGPQAAEAIGDLAAVDSKVARGVDMLSEGASNPYVACIIACAPLALQIARNHEDEEFSTPAGIRIPFIKKTIRLPKLRWRFKIGPKLRAIFTQDKQEIAQRVFTDPDVIEALKSRGVVFAERR
jgi:hypothetical protein